MLKIRMQRTGRINQPSFRIVVVEHTAAPKAGKFVERVGTYNPRNKERTLDQARIQHWLSVGAKPSDTVHNMLVSAGIMSGKKINVLPAYKAPETPEEAPAEAAAATSSSEAPAEEGAPEAPTQEIAAETPPETPAQ